jgi:hypothetical protein
VNIGWENRNNQRDEILTRSGAERQNEYTDSAKHLKKVLM